MKDSTASAVIINRGRKRGQLFFRRLLGIREVGVVIGTVVVLVVFYVITGGRILGLANVYRLLRQFAELGVMAQAVAVLMISAEFDLSVESYVALIPLISVMLAESMGINLFFGVLLGMCIAVCLGAINGIMVTKTKIPSFILTLGTMWVYRGIALILSAGFPHTVPNANFGFLMAGTIGLFPLPAFWLLAATLILWFLSERTAFGNRVFATGGNEEASITAGIRTKRIKTINFTIVAVAGAITGYMQSFYIQELSPLLGDGMSLEAIAAAVIGGCSLRGGRGSTIGALVGAMLIAIIRSGLVIVGINAYWQNLSIGLVLIATAIVNYEFTSRRR